jgi:hypothetical protein
MKKGMEIEAAFAKAYLAKLGMNLDKNQEELLGGKWLDMLQQVKRDDVGADAKYENAGNELAKLEGYPVVTDGKYYARRSGGQQQVAAESEQPEEESTDVTDVKKGLGGLAKGMFGKKKEEKPKGLEPAMSFYTEVLKLNIGSADAGRFQSPYPCK